MHYIVRTEGTEQKLREINFMLQQLCPDFRIELINETKQVMLLSLLEGDTVASYISMFSAYDAGNDMIYINLDTMLEYRRNGYIEFLMAVVILIGDSIYFIGPNEVKIFAQKIGLTATNVVSGLIVKKNFNYYEPAVAAVAVATDERPSKRRRLTSEYSEDSKDSYDSDSEREESEVFKFYIRDNIEKAHIVIDKFLSTRYGRHCRKLPVGGKSRKRKNRKRSKQTKRNKSKRYQHN